MESSLEGLFLVVCFVSNSSLVSGFSSLEVLESFVSLTLNGVGFSLFLLACSFFSFAHSHFEVFLGLMSLTLEGLDSRLLLSNFTCSGVGLGFVSFGKTGSSFSSLDSSLKVLL
jgi:hypothetical protein